MTDMLPWPGRLWLGFGWFLEKQKRKGWWWRKGCMERGKGKEGQANKQWNFIWAQQSLSLSLFLCISACVSCSGPLLLSQAKKANSMTVWTCTCGCICPDKQLRAWMCLTIMKAVWAPFFLTCLLILSPWLMFPSAGFPSFVQSSSQHLWLKKKATCGSPANQCPPVNGLLSYFLTSFSGVNYKTILSFIFGLSSQHFGGWNEHEIVSKCNPLCDQGDG